jgi:hypothetical protein
MLFTVIFLITFFTFGRDFILEIISPQRLCLTYLLTYVLTYLLTHGAEACLRSCQLCSYSRTSQRFMEPEGSLPPSQEPSTGLYSEPERSNPHHPILPL